MLVIVIVAVDQGINLRTSIANGRPPVALLSLKDNVPPEGIPSEPSKKGHEPKPFISALRSEAPHVDQHSLTYLNLHAPLFISNTPVYSPHQPASKPNPNKSLNSPVPPSNIFDHSSGEQLIERLAELLTQRQDRESLPRPEPEVFRGNPLQYLTWIKSFETFIERKTKDPSERLY